MLRFCVDQDEVRKKFNLHVIHKSVLEAPEWRYYWPVRVQGVCRRGFAFGFFFIVVLGLPYLCLLAAILRWDSVVISGKAYCAIKACYCAFCTIIMFPGMFFSAISSDKFEAPEFAYLLRDDTAVLGSTPVLAPSQPSTDKLPKYTDDFNAV